MRGLALHAAALGLAVVLALMVWLKDEQAATSPGGGDKVTVWGGNPDAVERIRFEGPGRKVNMETKKDGTGRYYVVSVEKDEAARAPHSDKDGGAPEPQPIPKHTSSRFVGVKAAGELADKVAPLLALRALGKYDRKQAEEFGFDKPEGVLSVKVGGVEQGLEIGGTTPGGQERYSRHVSSGQLYAVSSDLVQSLLGAETRLLERELHGFADTDVTRLRVTKGQKSRELVAMASKKGAYADAASPTKLDETVGNWMSKVGRLRVMEYVENPVAQPTPESAVMRIEYFGGTKLLGYLELYKVPAEKGSDFLIRTEYGRWLVKVLASVGEQVEQDLASVVK